METVLLIVFKVVLPGIFAAGAFYLAKDGKKGWGWFIFAALFLASMSIKVTAG